MEVLVGREALVALKQGRCIGLEGLLEQFRGFSSARLEVRAIDAEECLGSLRQAWGQRSFGKRGVRG